LPLIASFSYLVRVRVRVRVRAKVRARVKVRARAKARGGDRAVVMGRLWVGLGLG
jgi:hypothetical protein